ncbi:MULTISPECIES: transglycosylase SLT domain-containing protein [Rahnella]|uniref:peptidoglycan lytic exotransglycosylase n=2 Tax=Rahnella TaxID=34037 RepID=A0A6M2AZK3_9GAMM|nr:MULTISPECIES: transglycosylase SLT domain-containing protein [Rahnella]KAB8309316.1 lytic transglycosylase [Rouxiella chamberiensis]MBU9821706.1 transglycosylase SLT domain-containing protein [Rahnella sp. BCC 1045]MDF1893507.1 transglycosylase SLT domain-containing protein [Rahnella contaminans]MBF7993116.1 transglycosylase SLT domain-containing protein [Rahnella laticis]MBV6821275.1 transglycosylase SLT domain-containing protein [Rahnella sp. PD12R]
MKPKILYLMAALLLAGCAKETPVKTTHFLNPSPPIQSETSLMHPGPYGDVIHQAANTYGVDETLVKAIIQVESGYNPTVVSKSNAIGLMQLKASTAGRDAYRMKGRYGQPSAHELKDPAMNIDLGTAYLSILQQQLAGISNPETRRYATTVAYVNGAGALLRTFAKDKTYAIAKINQMSPQEFYQHVQQKHPAPQAPRYLWKVNSAYLAMR